VIIGQSAASSPAAAWIDTGQRKIKTLPPSPPAERRRAACASAEPKKIDPLQVDLFAGEIELVRLEKRRSREPFVV
jgi:hypothetical protein